MKTIVFIGIACFEFGLLLKRFSFMLLADMLYASLLIRQYAMQQTCCGPSKHRWRIRTMVDIFDYLFLVLGFHHKNSKRFIQQTLFTIMLILYYLIDMVHLLLPRQPIQVPICPHLLITSPYCTIALLVSLWRIRHWELGNLLLLSSHYKPCDSYSHSTIASTGQLS